MVVSNAGQAGAPIPTNLFDVYVQYKKDTKAVVSWLLSHHPTQDARPQDLTVRDLLAIAEGICARAVELPDIIAFHFRQAIAARTYLSKLFRKNSKDETVAAATENHEFFTSSLSKIYIDLCKCCAKPKDDCRHRYCLEECVTRGGTCVNRYEILGSEHNKFESSILPGEGPRLLDLAEPEDKSCDPLAVTTPSTVIDDGLSKIFELYQEVQSIHRIFCEVETAWQKVADGSSNLTTATAMTNAAYALIGNTEHRLAATHQVSNPSDILKACLRWPDGFSSSDDATNISTSAIETSRDLDDSWQALTNFRPPATINGDLKAKILNIDMTSQVSLQRGPDTSRSDFQCRSVLLSNMAQCISSSCLQNTFIHSGSPVAPELYYLKSHEQTPISCLHCASGLSLLMSTYKAYSFALPTDRSPSHCRIRALRFTQDAIIHVSAVLKHPSMPCRCRGTLAFHLESLKQDLEEYLQTKMFDFYFQSPWVCGAHILEMLHALQYYGLRLFAYRSYVGSVVHMYSVLRQLHRDFNPVPVLEALCEQLGDLFFPGGRPSRNFRNSYVRYMGGRLRFHGKARHRNGCHGLVIPAYAARANAGFSSVGGERDGRFDCGRFSMLWRIKDSGWRFDGDALKDISHDRNQYRNIEGHTIAPINNSTARTQKFDDDVHNPSVTLVSLEGYLNSSMSSPLPTALINHFPLYLTCTRIINGISDVYHGADAKPGQYCLCSVENLLAAADGCREGKGWRINKDVRELADVCAEAIGREFAGREMDEFVWANV